MTSQEGNRPHVLLDQVLRVPSGDERQEQDQIHLGGELQRRAGEQCKGESGGRLPNRDRKSTRLNSSHGYISYAVFCLKKKKKLLQVHPYVGRILAELITLRATRGRS